MCSFWAGGISSFPFSRAREYRLLRRLELAEPITDVFNLTLSSGIVPDTWKCANIIPIPKENLPKEEGDLRPISLTPCISKVMEEFVAE
jgi:hypothetical protein